MKTKSGSMEGGGSRRLLEPLSGSSAPRMLQRFAYSSAYPGAYPYVSSSVCAHVWYVLGLAAWGGGYRLPETLLLFCVQNAAANFSTAHR